jgi:hypothetical protein
VGAAAYRLGMTRGTRGKRVRWLSAGATAGLLVLSAGCGSNLLSTSSSGSDTTTSTTGASSTSTTVPVNGEVSVAFPVVPCVDAAFGTPIKSATGWTPTILVAPIPTSLVGKVTFYSDGVHTLLGPVGWTCALVASGASGQGYPASTTTTTVAGATGTTVPAAPLIGQSAAIAANGSTTLALYPPNDPTPPTSGAPTAGSEGVFATYASTGSSAGVDLVCPFFTIPSWQAHSAGCSTSKPVGELTNSLTPDLTAVADPAGVVGNLAASGGQEAVTGVVIFPQVPSAVSYGRSENVVAESCALVDPSLCPTIVSDFEVREFPVPS